MFKNTASQKLIVFAFTTTDNTPKTGDAANLTAYVSKDYGAVTVLTDTSATEMDSTNAKGYYLFDLTQAETNADTLLFTAKSSTANIVVIGVPATVFTVPASLAGATFPSGTIANTTNITAGTITTATNVTTVNGIAAGAITAAAIATDAIDADALAVNAREEIATAIWTDLVGGSDFSVSSSIGLLLYQMIQGSTPGGIADAVWDEAIAGHLTGGSTGAALNAAGSAGDPWATAIPGAYGAGTAGHRLGNIPDLVAGAAGGLMIAGSNAATTFATLTVSGATTLTGAVSMAAGLTITQSSANTSAVSITGNGTGHGVAITSGSGSTGDAVHLLSAASSVGYGLWTKGAAGGSGLLAQGGATGAAVHIIGGATNGDGVFVETILGEGIHVTSTGTFKHAVLLEAGGTSADALKLTPGSGGVGLRGDMTGNITGTITTTTNLTNLPTIPTGWLTADGLAADSATEIATAVLTTAMTEAYAADGATFTLAQGMYMLWAATAEFSIASTTITAKKLDGTTTAMLFTLDSATDPTSRTRSA